MEANNRFIICKNCTILIDTAMDRYWEDAFNHDKRYCASCIQHNIQLRSESNEVLTDASIPKSFRTEIDELSIAPLKTMFVCLHCAKFHVSKEYLKLLCNDAGFLPKLVWRYSIVKDERQLVNLDKVIFYNRKDS